MSDDKKLNVGVIFGGRSGEHAISLMSARFILSTLDQRKYNLTQIGISLQGDWLVGEDVLEALISKNTSQLSGATLLPDPSRSGLREIKTTEQGEVLEQMVDLDVLFPVLHGTFGEDGTLQGLFEMAEVAYVGAGVLGSSLGMDKGVFSDVMRANEIPIVEQVVILRGNIQENIQSATDIAEQVGDYPLFTKPANLGSSVGISKVKNRSDLIEGLLDAAQYDRRVVVQKGHNVHEIEVAVIGNDQPEVSVCGEIRPEAEFYSYEAKYHDDRSKVIIPADIPEEVSDEIRKLAIKAFKAVDLAGLARVDFFLDKDSGEIYLNELNTMPGFTQISMFPMLWEASGLSNTALLDRLIELAIERKADRDENKREFKRSD
ncbi:MAG: D-alanine--D-alanine ligase [Chloroflexi bacterium]|nr:D-alanine--D-alanine ligase [Chloroflexota bacterium]